MPARKQIRPDEKLPLKLTAAERKLVLEGLTCLDQEIERVVKNTPTGQPVMMTLREVLILVPGMTQALKKKLAKQGAAFSIGEVASMTLALAEDLPDGDARKQVAVMYLAKHLMDHLQSGIAAQAKPKLTKNPKGKSKATDALYQFKITLLGVTPAIWRRIQVKDCPLDKLHEHIQTAMGWTNSHLHQFDINGERYGDPELLDDGFEDIACSDSTKTNLSEILPKTKKRFVLKYEYDFGDGWKHEVLFEGGPTVDPKAKYPLCLEGERACPPEDCGGVWGYCDFLEAIGDKKHEQHHAMLEWVGGRYASEAFNAKQVTKEMKKGLPDWRKMS